MNSFEALIRPLRNVQLYYDNMAKAFEFYESQI
jgi:hypothetical protein